MDSFGVEETPDWFFRIHKMTEPVPTIETQCPECGTVQVAPRPWTCRGVICQQCQKEFFPALPPWQVPESRAGVPVSPRLRQILSDLSAIMDEPDKHGLGQEVAVVESLLRLLASDEGRDGTNLWAFHQWCAYGGNDTSYAPDALNDIYEELDSIGLDGDHGTAQELLTRLEKLKRDEAIAEPRYGLADLNKNKADGPSVVD